MTDKTFVDSNVWLYLFTADNALKSKAASEYIIKNRHLVISFQVVNEVCCVLKKKQYTESEIRNVANDMMEICEVCDCSAEIITTASQLREKHSFSYWDSHIVASALASQCTVLASEDMQHRLRVEGLLVENVLL